MGGQACVYYGAAEFSRDLDLLVLADESNLLALRNALDALEAETIAVPEFYVDFLDRGHAIHFRCRRSDVKDLRIDVMSKLRGTDNFERLWSRRTTIEVDDTEVDMLALPDLVIAKKTQRDKDWPMIRRLVEQSYFSVSAAPTDEQLEFLFLELRTAELLTELASQHPAAAKLGASRRPAVRAALEGSTEEVSLALSLEESAERETDRIYWKPLKAELEQLRRSRSKPE
jgi:hypothetical protein